ncbi:Rhamnan synthesis F [Microbacterium sp. C448]|uniref:rhamnan synthesis F family protein n=1 Tax=Microbacterium sp. C448 TaxID=1177594 RepID=UPI0003DE243E|nr:rhamnan synthesis F family protein [Microbacterium sp. C448]CDJ98890.1 Rhamnan synthesis F [Microbacterium sp. C448]
MNVPASPETLAAPRRLVIYVVYDRRGDVDDFIITALEGLRPHAERLFVVVNGELSSHGRQRLEGAADDVLVRANVGLDIWAHKAALDQLGDAITVYDEIVLTNDTWFGPVRPFAPVFARQEAAAVDFWGLTDHPRIEQPLSPTGALIPYHLQSFWLAVRRRMFLSPAWREYWRALPPMPTYRDAVDLHELRFTEHFASRGFVHDVVYPHDRYDSENPSIFNADEMLDDGSPILKRKPFFFWPPTMDHHAAIGRWTMEHAERYGYSRELMLPNLAKNSPPRDLNADAGLVEILPDVDVSYDADNPLRVLVVAHIFYVEMAAEMLRRADYVPGDYELVVTTPDADRARAIEDVIAANPRHGRSAQVRVLASNDGRDQSAFLIACRDLILQDRHDVLIKIHSKKTPQHGHSVGQHFRDQQFENLLPNPGYVANLLALFQRERGLGLVYPPMIHLGHGTLGHGWWTNKPRFEQIAADLGLSVPVDGASPLAPYGSMYAARPRSLRILAEREWRYEEFGGAEAYVDGGLAHVLERMPSYVAAEDGFHTRIAMCAEYAAISHTALEFKLDELSATIPGSPREKITTMHRLRPTDVSSGRDLFWAYMRVHHPDVVERYTGIRRRAGILRRRIRGVLPVRRAHVARPAPSEKLD